MTVTGFLVRSTLRRPLEELKRIAGRYASGIYGSEGSSLSYREFLPFNAVLAHMADMLVEVEDTGPGIAADELDKVFEVFEQAAAGRRSRDGTGLGMAISRDYARMMGGDLTVSSQLEKGSVFRLEIPVEEGQPAATDGNVPVMRVAGLKTGQASPRVLVVEDGEENRLLMVRLLEKVGFEVRAALNGLEAGKRSSSRYRQAAWKRSVNGSWLAALMALFANRFVSGRFSKSWPRALKSTMTTGESRWKSPPELKAAP